MSEKRPPHPEVTRLGGDEFVILLTSIAGHDAAREWLHITLAGICEPCVVDGHAIEIGVSAGLSIYPDHGTDAESLIKHADAAMYSMKRKTADAPDAAASREVV